MGTVPKPWTPIQITEQEDALSIQVSHRTYTFRKSIFPTSIVACGEELLASAIRIVATENDWDAQWHGHDVLITRADPDCVELQAMQESYLMIVNAYIKITYDGYMEYILKLAPRGNFKKPNGEPETAERVFKRFWIEIPFRKSAVDLSHNSRWGSHSRSTKAQVSDYPFSTANWYGNDRCGLSVYVGSSENWTGKNTGKAMETVMYDDTYCFRMRLLDDVPDSYKQQRQRLQSGEIAGGGLESGVVQDAVVYDLALQATPVKPFDANGIKRHIFHMSSHLMQGRDYTDFLLGSVSDEDPTIMLDYLRGKGVNTIVLHELWTETEGYWRASLRQEARIKYTIACIHQRGMEAIVYFCNSISTLRPVDGAYIKRNCQIRENGMSYMTYYRPHRHNQRVVRACLNGPDLYHEFFHGIIECVKRLNADGIYLDSCNIPWDCQNESHGCGYRDVDGRLHATFPVHKHHRFFMELYEQLHEKMGKVIQLHPYNCIMPSTLGFCDSYWCAEAMAFQLLYGTSNADDIDMDFFRIEACGRNLGVFSEFLIYESGDGRWDFRKGLPFSVVNGVFPRLNAMGDAADRMEKIWHALDAFQAADSRFVGYWNDDLAIKADDSRIYVSYYEKDGKKLVLLSNPHSYAVERVTVTTQSGQFQKDMLTDNTLQTDRVRLSFAPYSYYILLSQ